jgi:hypothetical protein
MYKMYIFMFSFFFSVFLVSVFSLLFFYFSFQSPFRFECLPKFCILVASPTMYKLQQKGHQCTHKLPQKYLPPAYTTAFICRFVAIISPLACATPSIFRFVVIIRPTSYTTILHEYNSF